MSSKTPSELMDRANMAVQELGLAMYNLDEAFSELTPKIYNLIEQIECARERIKGLECEDD